MKRLAGLILLLACSICWGATRDLYMDPSGSGTDCSTTAADKACSNFEKVVLALNTAPATDGDAVHVHMATGDYTQPAYTYGLDYNENMSGYEFTWNYDNTTGVTVTSTARCLFFRAFADTPTGSHLFKNIAFTATGNGTPIDIYTGCVTPKTFQDCTLTCSGTGLACYIEGGGSNPLTFTGCSASTAAGFISTPGSEVVTISGGGTYSASGNNNTMTFAGTSSLIMDGVTVTNASTPTTSLKSAIYDNTTKSIRVTDSTITTTGSAYGFSAYGATSQCYLAGNTVTSPTMGINIQAAATNVIIDGRAADGSLKTVAVNAPMQYTVAGTWAENNTITLWAQRGTEIGSYTLTVGATATVTQICADFTSGWNASNDPLVSKIKCTDANPELVFSSSIAGGGDGESFGVRTSSVVSATGGTFSRFGAWGFTVRPGPAIFCNSANAVIQNYNVRGLDAHSWVLLSVPSGNGTIVRNCTVWDSFQGIDCRADNVVIERCRSYNYMPLLLERGAKYNTIDHCTFYNMAEAGEATGAFEQDTGGDNVDGTYGHSHHNTFANNILVADGTYTLNPGAATPAGLAPYCIYDKAEAAGSGLNPRGGGHKNQVYDYNLYYAVNGGKVARLYNGDGSNAGTDYDALANLKAFWIATTNGAVGTRSQYNDTHSIEGNPKFVSTTPTSLVFLAITSNGPAWRASFDSRSDLGVWQTFGRTNSLKQKP